MNKDILLIEDDVEFADYLKRGLGYVDYHVRLAGSAEDGLDILNQSQPDFIILDITLPGMDGIVACRYMREIGYIGPILMLTARNAIPDRVNGLDASAVLMGTEGSAGRNPNASAFSCTGRLRR